MFLHIGNGRTVRQKDVIAILDMDTASMGKDSRAFLSRAQKNGEIEVVDSDLPRAILLCDGDDEQREQLYLTHISVRALCARANSHLIEEEREETE